MKVQNFVLLVLSNKLPVASWYFMRFRFHSWIYSCFTLPEITHIYMYVVNFEMGNCFRPSFHHSENWLVFLAGAKFAWRRIPSNTSHNSLTWRPSQLPPSATMKAASASTAPAAWKSRCWTVKTLSVREILLNYPAVQSRRKVWSIFWIHKNWFFSFLIQIFNSCRKWLLPF